uniref:Phage portal protein, lambda family n=1 Tax=Desulfovibrio sp. U5L TaxID=596152 RepID=I2Q2P7_9BACT
MAANWLDRLVGYVAPVMGLRRVQARAYMAAMGGLAGTVQPVRNTAGSREGTLANFLPTRLNAFAMERDADLIRVRAESLVASDGHAASCVDSLALNVAGSGLHPQSTPDAKALGGLTDEEADAFAESAEAAWTSWCREADAADTDHFDDLQYQAVRSMFVMGEFIHLPVWIEEPGRRFGLALQALHPGRLRTPSDLAANPLIKRGVEMGANGRPMAYWLAEPPDNRPLAGLSSAYFRRVPRKLGHRWGCFHRRHGKGPEQPRGETILAPAMKLFSDLSSYVDSELVGAVIAASFTVFMEAAGDPLGGAIDLNGTKKKGQGTPYPGVIQPGTLITGQAGHKPHLLANPRPPQSFDAFYTRILRAVAASTGQPYETVAKDFSRTNYSSARAALLEVWKLYTLYQDWFVRGYLQHVWEMVLEEAWLRHYLVVPKGKPDFYEARDAWCAASWTRPPRGQIDTVKERTGEQMGLNNLSESLTDILYSRGTDPETMARKIARERRIYARYDLVPTASPVSVSVQVPAKEEDAPQGDHQEEAA